jgi:aminoglycoside phosphotransferase (APT) family kinase protein
MRSVVAHLQNEWPRLRPGAPAPQALRWLLKTPRFRASGHVLGFVFADGAKSPELVVKVSRLPGDDRWIDREAANLRRVQAAREGGFDSIPRVAACDDGAGLRMLVQTVIPGTAMDRAAVRRRPKACVDAVAAWLTDLHRATSATAGPDSLRRLVAAPLDRFEALCAGRPAERALVRRTREIVAPLLAADVPVVFEHGDLSAPNILVDGEGRVGVVDWELADPAGLPATDLFFFLTFVAFARGRASSHRDWIAAFRAAFFGPDAWASPWIRKYADAMELPAASLKPLFVSTWARYVAAAATRLGADEAPRDESGDLVAWLRTNRFHLLWEYAVDHRRELAL